MVSPNVEIHVPVELVGPVTALLPGLVTKGTRRLEVFSYARPGETPYWLAFVLDDKGRHVVGTPDLRHLPLAGQILDLVRQLAEWRPGSQPEPL